VHAHEFNEVMLKSIQALRETGQRIRPNPL
jgi:hypothetical protein